MEMLSLAKDVVDRVEAEAVKAKVPVTVCVIDAYATLSFSTA
jgi:uncharacterized protein GlcG (DUF336 family)